MEAYCPVCHKELGFLYDQEKLTLCVVVDCDCVFDIHFGIMKKEDLTNESPPD